VTDRRTRRRARECALQFLFALDFTGYAWGDVIAAYWEMNPARDAVREYAEGIIAGVCAHVDELDAEIHAVLERWSPGRVGPVEQAAMRIALYEIRHAGDVPPGVAINEALEVVKRFGADDAPKFVNGVLDRLAKKLRAEAGE
jgi:N utilization substance protein B